jgi:hypothetical protein
LSRKFISGTKRFAISFELFIVTFLFSLKELNRLPSSKHAIILHALAKPIPFSLVKEVKFNLDNCLRLCLDKILFDNSKTFSFLSPVHKIIDKISEFERFLAPNLSFFL